MHTLTFIADPFFSDYKVVKDAVVENATGEKLPVVYFKAPVQLVNEPNGNRRIYPEETIEEELRQAQAKIQKKALYGEPFHPPGEDPERQADVPITNASHLWTKLYRDGKYVIGEGVTLPTRVGVDVANVLKFGGGIGFSVRMLSNNVQRDSNGYFVIRTPIIFVTFDIVTNPAMQDAWVKEYKVNDNELVKLTADLLCKNGTCNLQLVKDKQIVRKAKAYFDHLVKETLDKVITDWDKKFFTF